jgi:hypothetical protein
MCRAEPRSLYDRRMTWVEREASRADPARHENPQEAEEDEAAALLDKHYPTGGWFRRWLWRAAEGATRFGSGGGP